MSCGNCSADYLDGIIKGKDIYLQYEETDEKLTWCDGCGNYAIEKALFRALALEGISHRQALFCYDIGCSGNESDKLGAYTIHGLHGRVLPLAAGAVIANPRLKVIATAGDGATFSEGIGHLVHTVRNNYPIVFICHNNENYGLTTGQASSMTREHLPMNGSPQGVSAKPMNACQFVLSLHPTFVARSFSGDVKHMTEMMRAGLNHNGFAFIEIMQICPTYNKAVSQNWFWDRLKYTENIKDYNETNITKALQVASDLENEIAMGVLYRNPEPNFLECLPHRQGKKSVLTEEVAPVDISGLLKEFI